VNLTLLSCTHQHAGVAVRERLAFSSPAQLERAYHRLGELFPQLEVVILSTCNRVELYSAQGVDEGMPTPQQLSQFLADFHSVPLDEFVGELRTLQGPAVVRHLFSVVSSLDSMVLGEPQIVNQVKEAYKTGETNHACGPLTHALFQGSIRASARVRSETRLSEGRVSIASVAVGDFAKNIFNHFGDKLVLVIGAGEMAEETLRYLQDEGVRDVVVVNRSPERAQRLAHEWGGIAVPWTELDAWLAKADVVVSTTGADRPIVTREQFLQARGERLSQPVFILDLATPRDIASDVGTLENVFLYDLDSLQATCEENRHARRKEIAKAHRIIEEETGRFLSEFYRRASGDLVTQLRSGWHELAQQELDRLFRKTPHWTENDREQVSRTVERIVNKLLHPPLEALRVESKDGLPHGLMNALRRLFGLPSQDR
jgi:glutamyl-tRNA reductase